MSSYRANIQAAKVEYTSDHPVWQYNDKLAARRLAAMSNVRTPRLIAGPSPLRDLPAPAEPAVLKPVNGCSARGVHPLIPSEGRYLDTLTGRTVTWAETTAAALAAKHTPRNLALIARGHPDAVRPPWILEELVLTDGAPACDWKLYTVAARVEVIMQIRRTPTGNRTKWWTPNWEDAGMIHPGRAWDYDPALRMPNDPAALLAAGARIARHIPAPFVRVDLYEAVDGPVFGEITPVPLGGAANFTPEWDKRLGEAWDRAIA